MAELDAQVQIKLIELAIELSKKSVQGGANAPSEVTAHIEKFKKYYKDLSDAVSK